MTIETTLKERGDRYGDFAHHAKIAQDLQDVTRATEGWARLDAAQRQALTVICDKIARILSGDPNYADNWHDIQGYAKLVEDRLPKAEKANPLLNLPVVDLGPETARIIQEQRRHAPEATSSLEEALAAMNRQSIRARDATIEQVKKMNGAFGDGGGPAGGGV